MYGQEQSEEQVVNQLRKEIKQYIVSSQQVKKQGSLRRKMSNDTDFNKEITALWQRYHSSYPPIMLQIDLNEFCNRWQLGHIQLFNDKE